MRSKLLKKLLFYSLMSIATLSFGFTYGQITVSGSVTDAIGPVPGANIAVQGTATGTQTDFDGNYTLANVEEDAILEISFIGYQTQEIPVNGRETIDITLENDQESLEEVVLVGYGTQKKEDVTGSVGVVDMDNIKNMPVAGVDQALTGQIAGLQISTSNGIPGGGPSVRLRGVGAVGAGSEPLYVVDGFPLSTSSNQTSNPLNTIPPQDVQSITVLKDASATAIYGSRGANGVIIITNANQGLKN